MKALIKTKKLKKKIRKTGITYSISEIVDVVASDIKRLQYKISIDEHVGLKQNMEISMPVVQVRQEILFC